MSLAPPARTRRAELRLLVVEDSEADAELIVRALEQSRDGWGGDPGRVTWTRVDDEEQLRAALATSTWDVIVCDYTLPRFDAPRALEIVRTAGLDVPFLVVSGEVGEEAAVALMRAGAHDYLRKESLKRLAPAIARELDDADTRRERRKAAAALAESEERWQFAIEGAGDGVWDWSFTTGHVTFSRRWKEMLGYEDGDIKGDMEEWRQRVHPDDIARAAADIQRHLEGVSPVYVSEYRLRCKDGTYKSILSRGMVTGRGERGMPLRIVGTHTDLTERKAMEERLRQSEKMEAVGQLAGGVAHDFNNLLMILSLNLEQARLTATEGETLASLDEMATTVARASKVTSQLLSFARRQAPQIRVVDLDSELKSPLGLLQRALGQNIDLQSIPAGRPVWIDADVSSLEQIVMNLCLNARDAMPHGGRLTVATEIVDFPPGSTRTALHARPGRFACLRVTDTGQGIQPHVLARVFEPFFTTKEVGRGTGLGLASVYGMVQQHQGWVTVESVVGKGTTFRVYLPLSAKAPPEAPTNTQGEPSRARPGETVLLAEDEPMLREITRTMLKRLGYRVIAAVDAADALRLAEAHQGEIHALFTDMMMPGELHGLELHAALLRTRPAIALIVTSGYSVDLTNEGASLPEGAAFLPKPYAFRLLAETLRRVLG
jgi:PAS domain S-box-containing protein